MPKLDLPKAEAIVVGSGPNGLAAAIRLAQAGWPVVVVESAGTPGGGVRSAELTRPGFVHDVCSSVYPMAVCSPFLRTLPLEDHGLDWVFPPAALAHPFDDGSAALLYPSLAETVAGLGRDGAAYQRLIGTFVPRCQDLLADVLAPPRLPRHPFLMARFGLSAIRSAHGLARATFKTERARALFAGLAAHSMLPLEKLSSAAAGLALGLTAHAAGWPFVRGGAQQLTNALVSYLKSLGGQVITGCTVESLEQLPPARAVLLDVTPRQFLKMAGNGVSSSPGSYDNCVAGSTGNPTSAAGRRDNNSDPNTVPASGWASYKRKLERYRYGLAAYKIDWALSRPVPWRAPECRMAGTVHLGGTLDEICESERRPWEATSQGEQGSAAWTSDRPFVLFAQPSLFDPSRAPASAVRADSVRSAPTEAGNAPRPPAGGDVARAGQAARTSVARDEAEHTAWGYCHVPNGYTGDMTAAIEKQVERFAPGFRNCVLARSVMGPVALERHNPNVVGGDIAGGAMVLSQLLLRPTASLYRTPLTGVYLCSSSTPPGPGVHGMCGYFAAEVAMKRGRR
jgi:phytoene dehydrogenase-like protein